MTSPLPVVAGTLQTDPRSGGLKRSSGVNVLPSVAEAWAQVRDDSNKEVDWIIAGYDGASKADITVLSKGSGGVDACAKSLPEGKAVFGGCRQEDTGRFVTFFYAHDDTPTMQKGRASMHKNGVLNVLEGSDGEIDISKHIAVDNEEDIGSDAQPESMAPQKETVELQPESQASNDTSNANDAEVAESGQLIVSYEVLKGIADASDLPKGVDPLNREQALSDDEFVSVFGMTKTEFSKLPGWKRTHLKKGVGLF